MKESEELNSQVRKVSGNTIILMFSAGKESICCYYELKKYWENVILIYQYIHPDLTFVNETLDYFEKKFGQKIHRMPHVGLYRMVNEYVFMSPDKANLIEYIGLPKYTYKLYYEYLREDFGCPEAYAEQVTKGATIATDELRAYGKLSEDYTHITVNHSANEYVSGMAHVNGVEGFWSLMKRGINGIQHSVSKKHLNRYCDEYAYRYNSRKIVDTERFVNVMAHTDGRLTYKQLIHK